ncbi:MAG TPA: hypothetical protein PLP19_16305 [bacterium]|nr:hypothetical protein [bacterium]HPN45055.1 hypothetical protein [bacterium]
MARQYGYRMDVRGYHPHRINIPRVQVDHCVFPVRLDTSGLAVLDRPTRRPGLYQKIWVGWDSIPPFYERFAFSL